MRRILPVLLAGSLAACASFPQVDALGSEPGPPPPLLPLDDLLAQAGGATTDPGPDLAARAAALKARAAAVAAPAAP